MEGRREMKPPREGPWMWKKSERLRDLGEKRKGDVRECKMCGSEEMNKEFHFPTIIKNYQMVNVKLDLR